MHLHENGSQLMNWLLHYEQHCISDSINLESHQCLTQAAMTSVAHGLLCARTWDQYYKIWLFWISVRFSSKFNMLKLTPLHTRYSKTICHLFLHLHIFSIYYILIPYMKWLSSTHVDLAPEYIHFHIVDRLGIFNTTV